MSQSTESPNAGFVPIPSVGHELGILFGFAALMLVVMVSYWISWRIFQKKVQAMEARRREELAATDLYNDDKYDEKAVLRGQTEYKEKVDS